MSTLRLEATSSPLYLSHSSIECSRSKNCKILGYALLIISGVISLSFTGLGVGKLCGVFQICNNFHPVAMLALGILGGVLFIPIGLVGFFKQCLEDESIPSPSPQDGEEAKSLSELVMRLGNRDLKKGVSGVYVLSNESNIEDSIEILKKQTKAHTDSLPKCHIGVGALHNFDIMVARGSSYGIIFDFNPNNQIFIEKCLEFIKGSSIPEQFVAKTIHYIRQNPLLYNHYQGNASPIERLQKDLTRESSWLCKEDISRFTHIKNLVESGKIVAITQDFCEHTLFGKLVESVQSQGYCIDSLYLSNLYAYISLTNFHKTLEVLTQSNPLIIHCTPPASCRCSSGCRCAKEQHIGSTWTKTSKEAGAIDLKV